MFMGDSIELWVMVFFRINTLLNKEFVLRILMVNENEDMSIFEYGWG